MYTEKQLETMQPGELAIRLSVGMQRCLCCAVQELHGMGDNPVMQAMMSVWVTRYHNFNKCAFYLFTENHRKTYSARDKVDYIRARGLGTVTESRAMVNPNTGHTVICYLWEVNNDKFRDWWAIRNTLPQPSKSSALGRFIRSALTE